MAKIPADVARRVDGYVTKYMDILQVDGARPRVKLRNNSGTEWVGRADLRAGQPTTTIELQKSLFNSDRFLERVIAHEMVHHRNYLAKTEDEKHGAAFREGAARINAIMGPGFVAEKITPPRSFSTKLALTLGFGGLAFLAVTLWRKQLPTVQKTSMSPTARKNERGNYTRRR